MILLVLVKLSAFWAIFSKSNAVYVWYNSTAERTWEEAQSICRNKNMTMPVLNVTTAIQLLQKYPELDGVYLWFDGKCSWKNFTFSGLNQNYLAVNNQPGDENCLALECYGSKSYCKVTDVNCKNSLQLACSPFSKTCQESFLLNRNLYPYAKNNVCFTNILFRREQLVCQYGLLNNSILSMIYLPQGFYWFRQVEYTCQSAKGNNLEVISRENSLLNGDCFAVFYKVPYKLAFEAKDCQRRLTRYIICESAFVPTDDEAGNSVDDEDEYQIATTFSKNSSEIFDAYDLSTIPEIKETIEEKLNNCELGNYMGYGFIIGLFCGTLALTTGYFARHVYIRKCTRPSKPHVNKMRSAKCHSIENVTNNHTSTMENPSYQNFDLARAVEGGDNPIAVYVDPDSAKHPYFNNHNSPSHQKSVHSDDGTDNNNLYQTLEPDQSASSYYTPAEFSEPETGETNHYHTIVPDQK